VTLEPPEYNQIQVFETLQKTIISKK